MVAANSLACMYNRPHPPYITPAATAFLGGYHSTKGPALRGWLSRGGCLGMAAAAPWAAVNNRRPVRAGPLRAGGWAGLIERRAVCQPLGL